VLFRSLVATGQRAESFHHAFYVPELCRARRSTGRRSGKQLFRAIEQRGVLPIAWGENGFREVTNSKRPIRRPNDLHGLNIRVPPIPIIAEVFQALGATTVSLNWDQALAAFERGTVDGQENPIATLIIPYKLWTVHNHITLWHYMIDPLILAVNAKTWAGLSPEDRDIVRQVGSVVMELQKDEARDAPVKPAKIVELLRDMYGMQVVRLPQSSLRRSAIEPEMFMPSGLPR